MPGGFLVAITALNVYFYLVVITVCSLQAVPLSLILTDRDGETGKKEVKCVQLCTVCGSTGVCDRNIM